MIKIIRENLQRAYINPAYTLTGRDAEVAQLSTLRNCTLLFDKSTKENVGIFIGSEAHAILMPLLTAEINRLMNKLEDENGLQPQ